jgi:hypothetical protein
MEMNKSKKLYNGTQQVRNRRTRVIDRLEVQLKRGTIGVSNSRELTESDIKRINSELVTLKARI